MIKPVLFILVLVGVIFGVYQGVKYTYPDIDQQIMSQIKLLKNRFKSNYSSIKGETRELKYVYNTKKKPKLNHYANYLIEKKGLNETDVAFQPNTAYIHTQNTKTEDILFDSQLAIRVFGTAVLADKDKYSRILKQFDSTHPFKNYNSYYANPISFVLNFKDKKKLEESEKIFMNTKLKGKYIFKDANQDNATGLTIIENISEFQEDLNKAKNIKDVLDKYNLKTSSYVVQKLVENPLTLDGKKFDIRYFVSMVNMDPFIALFHGAYARKTLIDYNPFSVDETIHIANGNIQKKLPDYDSLIKSDVNFRNLEIFDEILKQHPEYTKQDMIDLDKKIKAGITYGFLAAYSKISHRKGMTELFAVDIVVDTELNPYMLEFNYSPSIVVTNKDITKDNKAIVYDYMEVAYQLYHLDSDEIFEKSKKNYNFACDYVARKEYCDTLINNSVYFNYIIPHDKENLWKPIVMKTYEVQQ